MTNLAEWFLNPQTTLTTPAEANPGGVSPGLMGQDNIDPQPYQAPQINLASYYMPWRVLFNRKRSTITGV